MRNEWFSDKRDHLKWSSLLLLGQREGINRVVQVAMWSDQRPLDFRIHSTKGPLDGYQDVAAHVAGFFHRHNDLSSIKALGAPLGVTIEVCLGPFAHATRAEYFTEIAERIRTSDVPTIWFFDPNTGIEPAGGPSVRHVREKELRQAFDKLPRGDFLVVYQHSWHVTDWQECARKRFSLACNVPDNQVEVFTSPDAKDVIILAVQKP